jgi:hypothetical protein
MADGDEIETALDLVVEIGVRHRLLGAREHLVRDLHLVDRRRNLVADRLDRAQVGDDAIEIARRENLVEAGRHYLGEVNAVGPIPAAPS